MNMVQQLHTDQFLLATKLAIPHIHAGLVARPRLFEQLQTGMQRPLTLLAAPAGFGKTMLLSAWIQQSKRSVGWVSLDSNDNDPAQFWAYVITALNKVHPGAGKTPLSLLQSVQSAPIETVLIALVNALSTLQEDIALVLDDYHVIESSSIHNAMTFLLDHLPPTLHLIIASRVDPPLPLGRLRVRRQLNELRADDLRFTAEEAATFLNEVMGLKLTAHDIAALETRTEGWIAGLQLAALSMQGRKDIANFVTAFTGSHRWWSPD
jgi:LuxR family transcriptional regulator, maltose regulon positive regulatory protein